MLLDLFHFFLFFLCLVRLVFWLLCGGRNFFSVPVYLKFCRLLVCLWASIFIRLGKFSSIILLKIFIGPLSWESSLSSIPIILRFHLLIVSWISWMFWVKELFAFCIFFDFNVNVFFGIFCPWDSLFYLLYSVSDACILTPDLFPRFSMSSVVSLCGFFIVSISSFWSWMVLFNSFSCLVVFYCNSLRIFVFPI